MLSLVIVVPLLVAVVGALVYALAANAKLAEMGRLAFATGLLIALLMAGGHTLRLGT